MNGRDSTSIENGTVRGVEVDPAHISASHSTMNGKRKPNPFNVDQSSASVRKRDRREDYAAKSVPVNGNDVGVPARTPDLSSLAGIEGDIPLAKIIEHVVAHALSELKDTLGRLHTKPIEERRRVLIDYTLNTRHRFAKLLSIVRWAIDAGKIQKYQQVAEKIYNQNGLFTRAVDGLSAIYFAMPQVRMRQYDVPNAVDVLSTGSYKRMPGIIRDKFTIPPKLDTAKIREAKLAINSIICRRLLNGEPIPPPMSRYRISDGRVTFTVPSEFEIELTLLQYSVSIPWHVMSLRVTVNSAETVPESMKISLAQHQVDALRTTCQDILIAPPLQSLPPEQTTSLTVATASKGDMTHTSDPHQPLPPLSRLYDFLHTQCLSIALEMMNAQAFILSRDQWE
ncbi:mediator complex subunit, partial [Spiromyces aspiralis]